MKRIIVADSGSTKTDFQASPGGETFTTAGINPTLDSDADILVVLSEAASFFGDADIVRFYGSGVRPEQEARMSGLLRRVFPMASVVEARSDMLGAARALCGHAEGQAAILGTGANSCLYDGNNIVANTPALGFILGDEGSGAVLGRLFLNAVYKGGLYSGAREELEATLGLSLADVIGRVYREKMPNRWLASLSPYIHSHICEPSVAALVRGNFADFIQKNIVPYHRPDLPVSAVGSMAFHYALQLREAADSLGYAIGKILQRPVEGMMEWETSYK